MTADTMTLATVRATGSRLDLLSHCQAWSHGSVQWTEDQAGEAARFGSAFHWVVAWFIARALDRWAEAVGDKCREAAQRWDVDVATLCGVIGTWIHQWAIYGFAPCPGWRIETEISYAWHPDTGKVRRVLTEGREGRQEDPREVVATLDLVAWGPEGQVVILDHKTGSAPSAAQARQLLFGALCVWREAEQEGREVENIMLEIHQIAEDGTIKRDAAQADPFRVAEYESELRDQLAVEDPQPTPGTHCTDDWCPALLACPVTRADVVQILPVESLIREAPPVARLEAIATAEDLIRWLEIKPKAKRMLEELDRQAKALADAHGGAFQLPDGRCYRKSEVERSGFDKEMAREMLGALASECDTVTRFTQYRLVGTAEGATKKQRKAKSNTKAAE